MKKEEDLILGLVENSSFVETYDNTGIDWEKLFNILMEKNIFMFLYPKLANCIPAKYKENLEKEYTTFKKEIDRHIEEIESIQKGFMDVGINAIYIKGLFLSQIAYKDLYARRYGDIDILVEKKDMLRAYNVVHEQGYKFWAGSDKVSGEPKLLNTPDFLFREDHHEFPCIKKDADGHCIEIEIKYATSAVPYEYIDDFMNNHQILKINHLGVKTFNDHYTLLHIIAHLYENVQGEDNIDAEVNLRDFIDLKMFLNNYSDIDWNYLYEKAKEFKMVHQVYFSLYSINVFWNDTISVEVLDLFNPRNITYTYEGNQYGERFTWKSDIVTRCFDRQTRLKEYSYLYKTELFQKNIARIKDDGNIYDFTMEKGEIGSKIFIVNNQANKCINLITLYDSKIFIKNNLYFVISFVDNDMSKQMVERNICRIRQVSCTNLEGEWKTYNYKNSGMNFISIKTDSIFSHTCDKIHMLIDIYINIGDVGFRGTGAKAEFILLSTSNK